MSKHLIICSTSMLGLVMLWTGSLARSLPILFSPPPQHYRVLKKLGQRGEFGGFFYRNRGGETSRASWNRPILEHWLRASQMLRANALLLRPVCRSCIGSFVRYAAEAIQVRGSPCVLPFECWTIRQIIVAGQRGRRMVRKDDTRFFSVSSPPFGLSVGVSWPRYLHHGAPIGYMTSFPRGHLQCPGPGTQLPVMAMRALAVVATGGKVELHRLIMPLMGSDGTNYDTYWPDRVVARFLCHWRFRGKQVGMRTVHLLMDWHLVPLRKGQPLPRGIVCIYPAYPSSGWDHGKMIRHLRWPVYALREGSRQVLYAANFTPAKEHP